MVQLSVELQKHIKELQTLAECKEVWKQVKERWREIEDSLTASAISKYKIGQIVQFVGKRKRVLYGKITKLNLKTARVDCDEDGIWNVGYTVMEKYSKS